MLTKDQCIEQILLYAESCRDLGNPERALGFEKAAVFLRQNLRDFTSPLNKALKLDQSYPETGDEHLAEYNYIRERAGLDPLG